MKTALVAAILVAALIAPATSSAAPSRTDRAPAACTRAVADARTIASLAGEGFGVAAKWPTLMSRLITAIQHSSIAEINGITRDATALNKAITDLTPRMKTAVARFNADAAGCK